jgi:gliding motility-associated-like protein/uncharacterized delta-60 repeat protein
MTNIKLVLTLLLLSVFSKSFAQPGALDASFAGKGLQTYSFKQNVSSETPTASVVDAAGNLYITGAETTNATYPFIAKLLPSGKPDATFGKNGKVILTDVSSPLFYPKAMALHPDGGIVLVGYITDPEPYYSTPCIVKLSSEGVVQNLGGKGTYVAYPGLVTDANAMFTGVHILPNGDILSTGDTGSGGDLLVTRITSVGEPGNFGPLNNVDYMVLTTAADASCSVVKDSLVYMAGNTGDQIVITALNYTNGNISTTFLGGSLPISGVNTTNNFCNAIQVNSMGHVIMSGSAANSISGLNDFMIYQLMPDGSFESCNTYNLGDNSESYSLVLDANDKMVLGGSIGTTGNTNWAILKVKTDGTIDAGFGISGHQIYNVGPSGYGANCLLRLTDGSYVLAGLANNDVLVKKITTSGAPAPTFGTGSEYRLWLADADSYISDMVVRSDGKFYTVGNYYNANISSNVPILALFKSDGTLDASFGGKNGADPGTINLEDLIPGNVTDQSLINSIQLQPNDGKLVLAGTYFGSGAYTYAFLMRLNADYTLDGAFGGGQGYTDWNTESYIHDIVIQKDLKILAYGFENHDLALHRYNADGSDDVGFASGGYYIFPNTDNASDVLAQRKVEIAVQPVDQKIIGIGTTFEFGSGDFLVFRLNTDGTSDTTFGSNGDGTVKYDFNGTDYATALCLKSDGKIVTGGYTQWDGIISYALLQLTAAGIPDTTFGTQKTGAAQFNKGYFGHSISVLAQESSNAIVASGIVQLNNDGDVNISALRITSSGVLDNTFSGKGHVVFGQGYTRSAALYNGSFYIAGANNMFESTPVSAEMIKLKLGTGPVIKSTNLQLTDVQKTYGDAPFNLKPSTNSSAAVQYSITHGTCATVDANTGVVTVKCVPDSPDNYIGIKAYQPATTGFTEAEANITVNVAKAIPKIIFNPQGGLIDSTILLRAITKSPGFLQFYVLQNPGILEDLGSGYVAILAEGCAQVQVTVFETQNYLQGTAITTVCGYINPEAPIAYADDVTLIYTVDSKATINVLANDEGRTGTVDPAGVDLDPSTPDVQDTVYVSPALGRFSVDTLGNVTYVPFQGFIGSGSITYTIRDSYGLVSEPGTLTVTQSTTKDVPSLKATELFTPNNDGLNDAFVIGWVDLKKENRLKVFDRNGQELFTQNNYRNDWTGDLPNGKEAENGIYYYVFQEGGDGDQRELKGVVELRR